MSLHHLRLRWPIALAFAFVLGFAAKGLWLNETVAASEDAVTVRVLHLTDSSGKARATLRLGDDGVPRIDLLDENGAITKSVPVISDLKMPMPFEILYGTRDSGMPSPPHVREKSQCLVLDPQIGFAENQ